MHFILNFFQSTQMTPSALLWDLTEASSFHSQRQDARSQLSTNRPLSSAQVQGDILLRMVNVRNKHNMFSVCLVLLLNTFS